MSNTLTISKCGETDFQYWAIATSVGAVPNSRVLLGELNKIIPVSETRFLNIDSDKVLMRGVPGEMVAVSVSDPVKAEAMTVECTIGQDGTAVLVMGTATDPPPHCM